MVNKTQEELIKNYRSLKYAQQNENDDNEEDNLAHNTKRSSKTEQKRKIFIDDDLEDNKNDPSSKKLNNKQTFSSSLPVTSKKILQNLTSKKEIGNWAWNEQIVWYDRKGDKIDGRKFRKWMR